MTDKLTLDFDEVSVTLTDKKFDYGESLEVVTKYYDGNYKSYTNDSHLTRLDAVKLVNHLVKVFDIQPKQVIVYE